MSTATRSTVNFRQYGNKSATQSKVDVVANLSTFYLSPVFTDPNYCTLHIPPTACVRTHYILLFVALVIIVSTISAACRVICCSAVGSQGSINWWIVWLIHWLNFCRAMLCTERTVPSQDVCPSVWLSHACIVSKWLNVGLSLKFFHRRVTTSVPFAVSVFRRRPPNGSVEYRDVKNGNFRSKYCFSSEMTQDRAIVTMERKQEVVRDVSNHANISKNSEWPLSQICGSWLFNVK